MPVQGQPRRIVVGITGASGALLGVQLLRLLRDLPGVESHLVVSDAGWLTLRHETDLSRQELIALAHRHYGCAEIGAAIASGSFVTGGMVIAPCSMRSLAAVAHGLADNLLTRAADVTLKERRPLVLLAREAPLNLAHLRNMLAVTEMGGIIFPPVPAYYRQPQTLQEATLHTAQRVLHLLGLGAGALGAADEAPAPDAAAWQWQGLTAQRAPAISASPAEHAASAVAASAKP
ncbi:MAG: UbiX family flavin prenyltransferase [Brachymonas sp.]|nr:UbiX family flavin prenyltransferase [Brachymonas sp.]MDO4795236.1 UbiX family flavin prenyltransferase [Brachymonas sp.]